MEGIELGIQDLDRSYQIDTQAPLLDNDKDHKEEPDQPTKRKRTKEEKERRRSEKRAKKEKRRSEAAQAAQAHAQSQSQSQVEVEAEVAEEPTDYDEVEQAVEDAPVNEGSKKRKEQKQKKDKSKGKGKEKEVGEEQEEEYREAIAASAVATLAQALVSSESDKIASPVDQVQTPSRPTTAASSSATSRTVPIQYSSMKSKKGLLESSIAPPASSLMPGPPPTQLIPVTPLTAASASASSTAVINSLKHSKFSNSVPKAMRNTRKGEDTKESDAQLRLRFRDPKAQEAWLASTSIGKTELLRLEREGILSYKKGKFTEDEKLSIKKALENYQKIHRMSSFDLVELVMTKTLQATDKETVREFWKDIAASVPGRPILNVQPFVRRMLDPKAHKGRWTPEEDELLLRAYAQHPREWTKISSIVDRTEVDCRDRYLKELVNRDTRTAGRWTKEEEDKLEEVVDRVVKGLRAEQAIGEERENSGEERAELVEPSDVPWDIVSKEMGNTRSMTQCRIKYRDAIWPRKLGLGKDDHVGRTLKVLTRLRNLNYESEKHISWSQVRETLEKYSLKEIRNSYTNLKKSVTSDPHVASLMYPELIKVMYDRAIMQRGRKVRADQRDYPSKETVESGDEAY
ncbi:nucleolar protein [Cryptococcus deuterogattii R265]|uniref:nucleolar protein n=1 Tax=Cryptococcus deuterogattii (strain R265) TaxID=294750 RepID=UPI001935EC11|nr:nucleolar protein [Cryptococcus deuterogattii R265]